MKLPWRGLLASLVVPALVSAGLAPVLHAHEADIDHPRTVVHRHMRADAGGHFSHQSSHGSSIDLSDHDEDAVWMDSQSVERSRLTIHTGVAIICANVSFGPAAEGRSLAVSRCDSLPHGPPGVCSAPRAPPVPSV